MLAIVDLAKAHGGRTLFRGASLQFHPGRRYGVVGANGSGKSTLLRILAGDEESSAGEVQMAKRLRVGVLRQDHYRFENDPILDVVMMGHDELWTAMRQKDALLERAHEEFDAERYGALEDLIVQLDGYGLEARASAILEGLAIPSEVHRKPLSSLSGGFKLRVLLARTLAADPDVLLLDEPTNHLDILSIRWLEKFVAGFRGIAVVVSHDHRFLNNVCTDIVDVDYERVTLYRGDYDDFERQKREDRERLEADIDRREKEIADHKAFIERFRAKPTKARQAKSKEKLLDRIVIEELPRSSRRYPSFSFRPRRPSGKTVLELDDVSKAFGPKRVLDGVDLRVRRGDRIAVIGPNGIGKSTLVKLAVGELAPGRGRIEWGYETHVGYFSQDHHELLGSPRQTLQSWLWNHCSGEPIGYVRSQLARVLFTKDEVDKKIAHLSGGEAARLLFARLAVTEPNVLVLDEPTNHLDLEGIEALAEALVRYDGTIVFVSHDRWFVSKVASRIVEISPAGIADFAGNYEEYLDRCGDDHLDADAVVRRVRLARGHSSPG